MTQIEQSNFIKEKFTRYIKSNFDIRDKTYRELFLKRLKELEKKLYKGPYVVSTLPFMPSKSIRELIKEGLFSSKFSIVDSKNIDRPCYKHQTDAFTRIKEGHNVVVTTGTSSGKTECFLYPIIDELIRDIDEYKAKKGIRVIFLFPMNALVNDQIKRIRELLRNLPEINFGFYTGDTPENNISEDDRIKIQRYKDLYGNDILPNEYLTRHQIKTNPPQILFTNYSMLEYLLIRPSDQDIISEGALSSLKFIVLDEAHVYKGSLGIEISLLMRRLEATANRYPQFILTSATLGRGKQDIDDILLFANNLTGTNKENKYTEKDVIFATRYQPNSEIEYDINPCDYYILDHKDNETFFKTFEKYKKYNFDVSRSENLYELLIRDQGFFNFYHKTKNVENFKDLISSLIGFDDNTLSSLISLINQSFKNNLKLLEIKYHMFIKAPDGAYITLGKNKDLSLTAVNEINGNKAFKIGICENCKTPYIMGITQDNILCIDDEIDIDESYDNKKKAPLEYYLIEDCITEEEKYNIEQNDNEFSKFYLCPVCGFITKNLPPKGGWCEHNADNYVTIYKYIGEHKHINTDEPYANNLTKCPICEYRSNNGGVIMGFHIGKDRASTLLTQILYDSMEYPIKQIEEKTPFGTFKKEQKLKKQFIIFSDSRQQAAFFSKFINLNYRKFLYKQVILQVLKENDYQILTFNDLYNKIKDKFYNSLGFDENEAEVQAKTACLWELMLADGRNSGEGLALYCFEPILGTDINDEMLSKVLLQEGFNISTDEFKKLVFICLNVFRKRPAIYYDLDVNSKEKRDLLGYRATGHKIAEQLEEKNSKGKKYEEIISDSFLPVIRKNGNVGSNANTKFIEKVFNYTHDKAIRLLCLVFQYAKANSVLYENEQELTYYFIRDSKYVIIPEQKQKFYRCKKCHKITPYNINNVCVEPDCDGELELIEGKIKDELESNYYRREYIERPVENVICREHTAQLKSGQAREVQDLFNHGKINFISCSTTFEMGIDLDGLSTVFMTNVPPTPANYAQRAGRAGRRDNLSAFILTFCSISSHDYTYFSNPKEMIRGLVKPPYFVIDNKKIILRHITSTALSYFFRMPQYTKKFDTAMDFLNNDLLGEFRSFLNEKPKKLGDMIDTYLLTNDELLNEFGNFKWIDFISNSNSELARMNKKMAEKVALYNEAIEKSKENNHFYLCDMYKQNKERLYFKNSLIKELSEFNIIPSYGFPINNVNLYIYNRQLGKMNDKYNLTRDLSVALSEYAPDSEIIVDENKYTSRYLFLPYQSCKLPHSYYIECPHCHIINTSETRDYFNRNPECKYCHNSLIIPNSKIEEYIIPIYGFVTAEFNKLTKRVKAFKTYASDIYYIGDKIEVTNDDNDIIKIGSFENEKLLIINQNNFYTCPYCGYTVLDKKNNLPTLDNVEHQQVSIKKGGCDNKRLYKNHLGYSYSTDIVKMEFINNDDLVDYDTALSTLYAILEGISKTFEIERTDINGILYKPGDKASYDFILFDTVSGGSGHVKRIAEKNNLLEVLENSLAKVSQECCAEDTSCYNCLRNYGNQHFHNHLKRGLAKKCLENLIYKMLNSNYTFKPIVTDLLINNLNFDSIKTELENRFGDFSIIDTIRSIYKELDDNNMSYPDYLTVVFKEEKTNKTIQADFAWMDKKILLFLDYNKDGYSYMSQRQNEYKCFFVSSEFDYVDFVKQMKGE